MSNGNRSVVYMGAKNLEVHSLNYPKLETPQKKKAEHGVILKVVATNICGSDQHIYRGRFAVPQGFVLGHEITGEVVETGRDVETLLVGDLVSVPFNVACGRCRNCKEQYTDVCERVNEKAPVGAYGFDLGGWLGGQAEYVFVPYADWNLLKFPNRQQALERMKDLAFLSDILPTGYHGCIEARVKPGSTVYIAGAGPVGRCAAASARLLGAACVIVGDTNRERLDLLKLDGFETVDLNIDSPLKDQIENILGVPEVDSAVDCVGYEAHGHGELASQNVPQAALDDVLDVTRAGGSIGVPGIYVPDIGGPTEHARQGTIDMDFGKAWVKSLSVKTGMAPVMKYNRRLMQAILLGGFKVSDVLNIEIISLDDVPRGYAEFDAGSSKKYVIDPHHMLAAAAVAA